MRSGAGLILLEPPHKRELRIHDPVLQIHRAPVIDLSDLARLDQLFRERDGRNPSVVERHHALDARLLHRREHLPGLREIVRERLFAEHMLTRLGRGDGDLFVRITRRGHIHQVDILPCDQLPPIGLVSLPAELRTRVLHRLLRPAADRLHHRIGLRLRKKEGHILICVAVGLSHKRISHKPHVHLLRHQILLSSDRPLE